MKEREEGNEKLAKELANVEQQLRDREGERAQAERVVDSLREELKRIQVELRSTREKLGLAEDGMESLKARISEKQQEVRMVLLQVLTSDLQALFNHVSTLKD